MTPMLFNIQVFNARVLLMIAINSGKCTATM